MGGDNPTYLLATRYTQPLPHLIFRVNDGRRRTPEPYLRDFPTTSANLNTSIHITQPLPRLTIRTDVGRRQTLEPYLRHLPTTSANLSTSIRTTQPLPHLTIRADAELTLGGVKLRHPICETRDLPTTSTNLTTSIHIHTPLPDRRWATLDSGHPLFGSAVRGYQVCTQHNISP